MPDPTPPAVRPGPLARPAARRLLLFLAAAAFPFLYAAFWAAVEPRLAAWDRLRGLLSYDYLIMTVVKCNLYVVLAIGVNLITGFCGQLTLGHAAFWAIGAYASALLSLHLHLPFAACFVLAGVVTAAFGVLIGAPSLRLSGDYLAITTLAFGEITRLAITNLEITGGALGLKDIPPIGAAFDLRHPAPFYYLSGLLAAGVYFVTLRIVKSKVGRAFVATREDAIVSLSLGINVARYKLLAFGIAAFFAGLAGSFYAHAEGYLHPDQFQFMDSVYILAMAVLGGLGNLAGSVVGAFAITLLKEVLRDFQSMQMVVFGLVLILLITHRPRGILRGR